MKRAHTTERGGWVVGQAGWSKDCPDLPGLTGVQVEAFYTYTDAERVEFPEQVKRDTQVLILDGPGKGFHAFIPGEGLIRTIQVLPQAYFKAAGLPGADGPDGGAPDEH